MKAHARVGLCAFVVASLLVAWLQPAGAVGELDPSFGTNGVFRSGLPLSDMANDVAVDANGKIVVVGKLEVAAGNFDAMVMRLNPNGTLDTRFDGDGLATANLGSTADEAIALVARSDGTIVVAAKRGATGSRDFALVRFLSNGKKDPAFSGDGIAISNLGGDDVAGDLFVQSTGEPVVVGTTAGNFAVVRYTSVGVLDPAFGGGDGIVTTDFVGNSDNAYAVTPTSSVPPKIVVAGSALTSGTGTNFAVARYANNGTPDTTFDTDGKTTIPFAGFDAGDTVTAVRVAPFSGKIVLAGTSDDRNVALARLTTTGALDSTFGTGGKVITTLAPPASGAHDLALLSGGHADGPIVVLVNSGPKPALVRYLPTGALDTNYADGGVFTLPPSTLLRPRGMAIQADGKFVITMLSTLAPDAAVARLQPTSSADLSLTATHSLDTPGLGGPETFTEAVTNLGPTSALGAKVTVTLDPGLVLLSATDAFGTCTPAGQVITCTLGTIAPGGTASVDIRTEGDVLGPLTAAGAVSDANSDPNAANNSDPETITVVNSDGCTIIGTAGNDALAGTSAGDVICGLAGNDTVTDPGGNDTLLGGTGNDSLNGGKGIDTITGDPAGSDPGNDSLTGGNGADTLNGADGVSGNDVLDGSAGVDACTADAGDTISNCP